ncbi:hypothetical protein AB0J80_36645 [Actinoplanes sp. NPDC049548]|uniref:hypothetical protein n=1 Tax=Actinoplanes sp. NPDC049548 TaxID=3155152 RepID=UPI003422FF23
MSLPVDLPPPRRPLFFPVVIATVFLSIIGMSAGFALGTRHESGGVAQNPQGQESPAPAENTAVLCPEEMHETARKLGILEELTQVLRVRADETGTTVWICRDPGGKLYYQANRGGEQTTWIEGQTALFLSNVIQEGDTYTAMATDGNSFVVNDEVLRVTIKGKEKTYAVRREG